VFQWKPLSTYVPRCLQNGINVDSRPYWQYSFKRGLSKIEEKTFDCSETEVGDGDTAAGGII
jgi:hypothetical protein